MRNNCNGKGKINLRNICNFIEGIFRTLKVRILYDFNKSGRKERYIFE